jgi:hypothetical protein
MRVRSLELAIPKPCSGSCFSSFPEPRRCSEAALCAVSSEGDVKGVRTRMVGGRRRCGPGGHLRGPGEPPLQGLRSARGCLARPTTYGRCPYPRFDARCANARDEAGRVVSPGLAAAIAEVPQEVHTAGLPAGLEDGLLAGVDKARLAARGGPWQDLGSRALRLRASRRRSCPSARRSKPGRADIKTARFVHSH